MKKVFLLALVTLFIFIFMYEMKPAAKVKKVVTFADSPVHLPMIPEEYLNKELKYKSEWLNMPGNLV